MDKKPHKDEEPQTPDIVQQSADTAIPPQAPAGEFNPRYIDGDEARKITEKLMRVHGDLLRRLAEYDRTG